MKEKGSKVQGFKGSMVKEKALYDEILDLGMKPNWVCREIADIVETSERQVTVLDAETRILVRLPRIECDFGHRMVLVSAWAWAKIYKPTIERRTT